MKPTTRILVSTTALATVAFLSLAPPAAAEEEATKVGAGEHKHDHAKVAGPNGGKVIHEVEPHAELFVTKDRKLQLTFLDDEGKATALAQQSASVTCGKRTAPTRMTFAKKGNTLLSDKSLPDGMLIPTVLQIKMTPKAKATTLRLNLNLEDCPGCDYLEYACICDHGDDGHEKEEAGKK